MLDLLGEGELLGHPSMVSGTPTGFEARAHEDTLCYALAAEDVLPLLARPAGLRYLARSLLARPKPGPVVAADVGGFDLAQQPVRALIREQPIICEPDVSLRDAARRMADTGASSVLVRLDSDGYGIVTDQDLRSRVVAEGLSVDAPVSQVMTAPAFTIGPELNGADVVLAMLDRGIRHLSRSSRREARCSASSATSICWRQRPGLRSSCGGRSPMRETSRNSADAARRVNPTLIGLHQVDLPPAQISSVISVVVDALIRRAIELAIASTSRRLRSSPGSRSAATDAARVFPRPTSTRAWCGPRAKALIRRDTCTPSPTHVIETLAATGWQSDAHGVTAGSSVLGKFGRRLAARRSGTGSTTPSRTRC